jgi:hypothetical protein
MQCKLWISWKYCVGGAVIHEQGGEERISENSYFWLSLQNPPLAIVQQHFCTLSHSLQNTPLVTVQQYFCTLSHSLNNPPLVTVQQCFCTLSHSLQNPHYLLYSSISVHCHTVNSLFRLPHCILTVLYRNLPECLSLVRRNIKLCEAQICHSFHKHQDFSAISILLT